MEQPSVFTDYKLIAKAWSLAKAKGYFILEKLENGAPIYLLYRKGYQRNHFVGKRSKAAEFLKMVKKSCIMEN